MGPTQTLAAYVAAAQWEDIPDPAREATLRTVTNSIGCALGGARHPAVDTLARFLDKWSGERVATVIGRPERFDPSRASLINGLSGSVYAFDDTHAHSMVHPGTPITVAALAAAQASERKISGARYLNACAWGLEVTCRVSRAISPRMPMAFSQTGIVGTVGASVAAGVVLNLDAQRLGWAIGIAAASASGIRAGHGSLTMHLLPARAACSGVEAALLAQAGCDSTLEVLDGKHGFFAAFGDGEQIGDLLLGFGDHFELCANTFKPYPCGIVVHPVIDACMALRTKVVKRIDRIDTIYMHVAPKAVALADRTQPTSELEAQVSLQHWAAVGLLFGRAGIDEGELPVVTGDPRVAALRGKCIAKADPEIATDQSRVEIRFEDGSAELAEINHCRGSIIRPLSDVELSDKFMDQAKRTLGEIRSRQALDACWSLATIGDMQEFVRCLD
jgi:2-methylcitrate dehydratase PrpD